MSTLIQEIERLKNAKTAIDEILVVKGVSIPANATLDTYANLINSIKTGTSSAEVTATKANVLVGTTTITSDSSDAIVEGTMPNNGAVTPSALGAGGSYTIPVGYHNGSGKVTVQSLATMTADGDATAAQILSGKKAYVDGNLITGTIGSKAAATYYATTSDQTIAAGQYLSGDQKISKLTQTNLTAANILKGKTITINNGNTNVWSVAGSLAVTSAISFKAAARSSSVIRITWTNPSKGPWSGVKIRYSTSSYPGVSGGTLTYTGTGSSTTAGGSSYVDITGLSMGTTYYFTCYSYATGLGDSSTGYNCTATTSGTIIYNNGSNPSGLAARGSEMAKRCTFSSSYINIHTAAQSNMMFRTTTTYNFSQYKKVYADVQLTGYFYIMCSAGSTKIGYLNYANKDKLGVTTSGVRTTLAMDISSDTNTTVFQIGFRSDRNCDYWESTGEYSGGVKGYIYKIWLE